MDPGYSKGGGGLMVSVAHGGGSGKGAIEAFTMFVAKFIFLWHLHLFIAARILLYCLCIQGASSVFSRNIA